MDNLVPLKPMDIVFFHDARTYAVYHVQEDVFRVYEVVRQRKQYFRSNTTASIPAPVLCGILHRTEYTRAKNLDGFPL